MFKKILVPLDGSQLSQRALEPAAALARRTGAELLLVRAPVTDTFVFAGSDARQASRRDDVQIYLDTLRQFTEQAGLTVHTQLIEGDAAGAIVDTALLEHADMISMSTHGYSGLTRWVLGSVTEKVLRTAPCPVWVVRTARTPQKILITLDGSTLSETALEPGCALAQGLAAEVALLRTVPCVTADDQLDAHERGSSRRMQEDLIDEAREYVYIRSASYAQSGLKIKPEVRIGAPADCILEYIETYDIDLIVMATHGRTGLKRWVYGSVTDKVLRSANCSLLVIRPAEADLK